MLAALLFNPEVTAWRFLFASSLGVYGGFEQPKGPVTDHTLQRPNLIMA